MLVGSARQRLLILTDLAATTLSHGSLVKRLFSSGLIYNFTIYMSISFISKIDKYPRPFKKEGGTSQSIRNTDEEEALPPGLHFHAGVQLLGLTVVGSLSRDVSAECMQPSQQVVQ